ncbi:hypothetical protein AB4Y88_23075, partial [Paenarthrobacter sp. RAF9]
MNSTTEQAPALPEARRVPARAGSKPPGIGPKKRKGKAPQQSFRSRLRRDKQMLLMMVPGVAFLLLFFYIPILGNVIAFQDYQPYLGIGDSLWVGWQNFVELFGNPDFLHAFWNTLYLAAWQLVFLFPVPLVLALIVDSLISTRVRKIFQSIAYLPHFLSWVLVIAFFQQMLGGAGFVNNLLRDWGMDPIPFMTNPETFPLMVVVQMIWKDAGWAMIIFLAALASIDGGQRPADLRRQQTCPPFRRRRNLRKTSALRATQARAAAAQGEPMATTLFTRKPRELTYNPKRPVWKEKPSALYQTVKAVVLIVFSISILTPILLVVSTSLADTEQLVKAGGFVLWPERPTFEAYATIFKGPMVLQSLGVSMLITAVGTILALFVTITMAYATSRTVLFGRPVILAVLFTLLFAPGLIPSFLMIRQLGLLDSLWSLILPGIFGAFNFVVMRSFFMNIPGE